MFAYWQENSGEICRTIYSEYVLKHAAENFFYPCYGKRDWKNVRTSAQRQYMHRCQLSLSVTEPMQRPFWSGVGDILVSVFRLCLLTVTDTPYRNSIDTLNTKQWHSGEWCYGSGGSSVQHHGPGPLTIILTLRQT